MGYSAIDLVKAMCPNLANSEFLDMYMERAILITNPNYFGAKYSMALALRACHLWTLDKRAGSNIGAPGAVQSMREGGLSISYSVSGDGSDLSLTHYGKQLQSLIKTSGPAMRTIL
jgi:hypothetical protein